MGIGGGSGTDEDDDDDEEEEDDEDDEDDDDEEEGGGTGGEAITGLTEVERATPLIEDLYLVGAEGMGGAAGAEEEEEDDDDDDEEDEDEALVTRARTFWRGKGKECQVEWMRRMRRKKERTNWCRWGDQRWNQHR